jgi:hypothetical protein
MKNCAIKPGDFVRRSDLKTGVIINKDPVHDGFWKVLTQGSVQVWFIGNFDHIGRVNSSASIAT